MVKQVLLLLVSTHLNVNPVQVVNEAQPSTAVLQVTEGYREKNVHRYGLGGISAMNTYELQK